MLDYPRKVLLLNMNKLPLAKRTQITNLLVEGNSLRATSRIADVSINTVTKLLVEVGHACEEFHNGTVRDLNTKFLRCGDVWSFTYAKPKNNSEEEKGEAGDIWTCTALDLDSKLIVSWLVGDRSEHTLLLLLKDAASRIVTERINISTDSNLIYTTPIGKASFGDHALVQKTYETDPNVAAGDPGFHCTSKPHLPRQNATMRRFTKFSSGFSKKIDNHMCAIALHVVYHNFVKVHKTLCVTPAMEAGLTKRSMTIAEIVELTIVSKPNRNTS